MYIVIFYFHFMYTVYYWCYMPSSLTLGVGAYYNNYKKFNCYKRYFPALQMLTLYLVFQSLDTEEMDGEVGVSITGQKSATPPRSSSLHLPLDVCATTVCEGGRVQEKKSIASKELDKRLQNHLNAQAEEW